MNQALARPDGAGGVAQLANGRKTFIRPVPEDQLVTTGGFIPNQIALHSCSSVTCRTRLDTRLRISLSTDAGYWDGSTIAAPAHGVTHRCLCGTLKRLPIDNVMGSGPAAK